MIRSQRTRLLMLASLSLLTTLLALGGIGKGSPVPWRAISSAATNWLTTWTWPRVSSGNVATHRQAEAKSSRLTSCSPSRHEKARKTGLFHESNQAQALLSLP